MQEWQLTQLVQMTERSMSSGLEALRKNVKGICEARVGVEKAVERLAEYARARATPRSDAKLAAAVSPIPPRPSVAFASPLATPSGPSSTSCSASAIAQGLLPPPLGLPFLPSDRESPLPPALPLTAAALTGARRPREEGMDEAEGEGEGGGAASSKRAKATPGRRPTACTACRHKKLPCVRAHGFEQQPCDKCVGVHA